MLPLAVNHFPIHTLSMIAAQTAPVNLSAV